VTAGPFAGRMAGTVTVVRFNWPKYLGVLALPAIAAIASTAGTPEPVPGTLWAAGVPGLAWTITSLVSTWWVYDHRHVYGQLAAGLGEIGAWAAVHAGFDESAPALRASAGRPPVCVVELALPPGPSLRRARRRRRDPAAAGSVDAIPLAAGSLDSVFVTFAAHEVRDPAAQRALFAELRRVLRPGGRLVITEHPRDLANIAVYGPGALHFQPLATWHARAAEAGLTLDSDAAITPFVRRLVYRR
jgi:SAM-dependent methyltransferase